MSDIHELGQTTRSHAGPVVLINDVYAYGNLGDSALAECIVLYVRDVLPEADVYLLSQFWEINRSHFDPRLDVTSVPLAWDVPMDHRKGRRAVRALRSLSRLIVDVLRGASRPLPRTLETQRDTLELYRRADVLIDKGGGSLYSSNRYVVYLGLYQHLLGLWAGCKLGKPVVMAPQSVGPLRRIHDRWAVRRVLSMLAVVMVRDPASRDFLAAADVPHICVPDSAFLGNFVRDPTHEVLEITRTFPEGECRIGVVVHDWRRYIEGYRDDHDAIVRYLEGITAALTRVSKRRRVRSYVFPHVVVSHGDDDRRVSDMLATNLAEAGVMCNVVDCELTPSDRVHLYGAMDLFLGTRLHSSIFAMLGGVPAVGMSYQPKFWGTYEMLGLTKYCMDVRDTDETRLSALMEEMLADLEATKKRFDAATDRAKQEVAEAFERHLRPILESPRIAERKGNAGYGETGPGERSEVEDQGSGA